MTEEGGDSEGLPDMGIIPMFTQRSQLLHHRDGKAQLAHVCAHVQAVHMLEQRFERNVRPKVDEARGECRDVENVSIEAIKYSAAHPCLAPTRPIMTIVAHESMAV